MSKMQSFKDNLLLSLYAWSKIPLIGFCSPRVVEATNERTVLKIKLGFRTKNHLGAMYFGALAIGSELCIAMLAVKKIKESGERIDFLFKDYKAEFLKRAEGDVLFICEEAQTVVDQIEEAKNSTERINRTMTAYAIVPSVSETEKVATFALTLSVKRRKVST
ncbi:MAG: DUF4442 domain-containing protein [Bdellovibrionales bacterium RIFCSPHIGHO2_01_FULL_40_29]|nr:MAG: DUF4442 domain-containing protein [Bdellovibrionales bacterium RIFCSPHIGHO2_01_FULL_40_29]OFZ34184.1 MAG: DUF4442 domain-containing protein [Bdellovibrionales bacterium RIFCSPHIGHO2_02_FULL_40_15]